MRLYEHVHRAMHAVRGRMNVDVKVVCACETSSPKLYCLALSIPTRVE